MLPTLAFFTGIGPWEIILLALVALLIFGKRLPEVGKSLGKGIVEFKKGLGGIEDEIDQAGDSTESPPKQLDEKTTTTVSSEQQKIHADQPRNPASPPSNH